MPLSYSRFARALALAFILPAPALAQWATPLGWHPAAPSALARFEAQGAAANGKLYVLGGFDTGAAQTTDQCEAFDPATNSWTQLTPMPEEITHSGAAVDGRYIYLAGGFVGDHPGPITEHAWRYDTQTDTWTPFVPLPAARGGGMLVRLDRELHFFGGNVRQGGNFLQDSPDHWALALDSAAPAWVARAPMPNPRNHLGGAALNGILYAIGGQHLGDEANGNQTSVDAYDPTTDTWTARAPLPRPMGHLTSTIFPWRNHLVIVAGVTNGGTLANVIAYDPTTDAWEELPPLPQALHSPVAVTIGDHLIVNGGTNTILHTETWTTDSARVGLPAELLPGKAVAIWPNPRGTAEAGLLLFDTPLTGACTITLTDALGRVCQTVTLNKEVIGLARLALPATQLAPGVYTLTVRQGERLGRTRLIVQ